MGLIKSSEAQQVIRSGNALVKVIRSTPDATRNWDYLLDQLRDPQHCRPIKITGVNISRLFKYDFATKRFMHRDINVERGTLKDTVYTKKTSVTLMPPHGMQELFRRGTGEYVGLLFNLEEVKIKEGYVFEEDINSDDKPWLFHPDDGDFLQPAYQLKPTSIPALKEKLSEDQLAKLNEIMACLKKGAAIGIVAGQDNLISRVAALSFQAYVWQRLNIVVPVYFKSFYGITLYTPHQQNMDICTVRALPNSHPAFVYHTRFMAHIDYLQSCYTEEVPSTIVHLPDSLDGRHSAQVRTAIESDEYYRLHSETVIRACTEMGRSSIDELLRHLYDALELHQYISPLIDVIIKVITEVANADRANADRANIVSKLYRQLSTKSLQISHVDYLQYFVKCDVSISINASKLRHYYYSGPKCEKIHLQTYPIKFSLILAMEHSDYSLIKPQECKTRYQETVRLLAQLNTYTNKEQHDICYSIAGINIKFSYDKLQALRNLLLEKLDALDIQYELSYDDRQILESLYVTKIKDAQNLVELNEIEKFIKNRPSYQKRPSSFNLARAMFDGPTMAIYLNGVLERKRLSFTGASSDEGYELQRLGRQPV